MLVIPFAVFALLCSVTAAPRERRFDAFDSSYPTFNPMPFPYARPFGTFSGFGMGLPWFQPVPMYIPVPDVSQFMPWYKGNNVCETKKVMEEPDQIKEWMDDGFDGTFDFTHESENCRGNNNKYMCIKRILTNEGAKLEMTKYECCYGFVRATRGPGCVEIDLRYIMPTLRNMGATQMVKLAEKVGMMDDFHDNNYTVFCPPNSALETMQTDVEDELENDISLKIVQHKIRKKTRLYNIMTSHLSPGFFKTDDFADGQMLQTDNLRCEIRINVYFIPHRIITANCVPILSEDHFARNGIIHVVEKVLPMPTKTVADIIAGDPQFSILKRMLGIAGLVQTLRSTNASYTMFAPTDSAFMTAAGNPTEKNYNRCTI